MERFKALFAIDKKEIQKNCVIVPFLAPKMLEHLGVKPLRKGVLYSTGQGDDFTFILARMGAAFIGDCVLQLKDTACENIIFLGSCGLINQNLKLDIGDLVLPTTAFAMESFSDLLAKRESAIHPAFADGELLKTLAEIAPNIQSVSCASFASLELEEGCLDLFQKLKADIIEMECAALFNAAHAINKKAAAMLFTSDILGDSQKKFWKNPSPKDRTSLADGINQACLLIKKLFEKI